MRPDDSAREGRSGERGDGQMPETVKSFEEEPYRNEGDPENDAETLGDGQEMEFHGGVGDRDGTGEDISTGPTDAAPCIDVRTSENRLRAEIRIVPSQDGSWPVMEAVREALRSHGVVFGVEEEAIKGLLLEEDPGKWVPVARGNAPKHGEDGWLEVLVDMGESGPHEVENSGGQMDMKDLGLIRNVEKGSVIARKVPPSPEEDGVDVMGTPVKARKGKEVKLLAGSNTELSEDRLTLTALIDGHLTREENKFHMKPIFEVYGDVDYSTGDLSCYGGIKVQGAVKEGFRLEARGPIEVFGVVEGAELLTGSDMILKGSVRGMDRGILQARSSITAVYIDQCTVSVGKDLVFQKALMHCDIKAGGCVRAVAGNRGIITGGKLQAGVEVECQILGNEMGTKTEVSVGIPPELVEKRKKLKADMESLEVKKTMVEKNLVYLGKVIRREGVDPARRGQVEKFMKLRDVILRQMELGEKGLKTITDAIDARKHGCCVKVHGTCYPGVSIAIRGAIFKVRESLQEICFVYDEKRSIISKPLK